MAKGKERLVPGHGMGKEESLCFLLGSLLCLPPLATGSLLIQGSHNSLGHPSGHSQHHEVCPPSPEETKEYTSLATLPPPPPPRPAWFGSRNQLEGDETVKHGSSWVIITATSFRPCHNPATQIVAADPQPTEATG